MVALGRRTIHFSEGRETISKNCSIRSHDSPLFRLRFSVRFPKSSTLLGEPLLKGFFYCSSGSLHVAITVLLLNVAGM